MLGSQLLEAAAGGGKCPSGMEGRPSKGKCRHFQSLRMPCGLWVRFMRPLLGFQALVESAET